ncbi:MAG: arginine--tRNA ligase [Gammaproteobacteria bacterium]|nr:MAG: arginine--tRNA ligase [Gammaproteobacteria bacterium]
MKERLRDLLTQALERLHADGQLPEAALVRPQVERTRDPAHGDFATNLALTLARPTRRKPREIAEALAAALPENALVHRVEVAGPGFINFFLSESAWQDAVREVLARGTDYGRSVQGGGRPVQVEFVSANPTGPLHVGHGRGAAYGASVANLLEAVGYRVHREYYVNDAGRQMDILAASVYLRYLELCGEEVPFPSNAYQGDYVWDIGATLHRNHGEDWRYPVAEVFEGVPPDAPEGDKEAHIDALIERIRTLLGPERYREAFDEALNAILANIRQDLKEFGVVYDDWFSERSLVASGAVERALARLRERGHLYEKDGAVWFRSTAFGDEKDRVVVRENGQTTYFASDIAYHMNKLERGYERVIDVWGADHHGYVPRIKAALAALGDDPSKLDVLLVQFAVLYRGGEKVQMSTRSGEFVTLRELRREVGNDAARFFYVLRKAEQHLDFDLDLARARTADNPVYAIQYAHARVCSVFRQLQDKGLDWDRAQGAAHLHLLHAPQERDLMKALARYPELVLEAALAHEPHQVAHFLRDLAHAFHTWYNAHQFLVEDARLRNARLALAEATRQVIANGLALLGVSAPERM